MRKRTGGLKQLFDAAELGSRKDSAGRAAPPQGGACCQLPQGHGRARPAGCPAPSRWGPGGHLGGESKPGPCMFGPGVLACTTLSGWGAWRHLGGESACAACLSSGVGMRHVSWRLWRHAGGSSKLLRSRHARYLIWCAPQTRQGGMLLPRVSLWQRHAPRPLAAAMNDAEGAGSGYPKPQPPTP